MRSHSLDTFALDRGLVCFKCQQEPKPGQVAKTGVNARGPWMICVPCVQEHRSKTH